MNTASVIFGYWRSRYAMTPGQRNSNLLILAFQLNKHRVPAAEALNLCLRMQQDGFPASEVYTVVSNAYRTGEVGCEGCRWCGQQAPPPPSPYRVNTGFTLTPEQRQQLVAALRKARRQQAVTSTPTPAEGVTSSTGGTVSEPVTTSTDCKEQAGATPPSGTAAEAFNRWAALNPALNTLSQAFDLDLSRARFSTPPSEQVNRPRHERENCHAAIVLDLHRELPHLAPYTLALELFVRSGVNLSGQQVAKLLRDAGDQ